MFRIRTTRCVARPGPAGTAQGRLHAAGTPTRRGNGPARATNATPARRHPKPPRPRSSARAPRHQKRRTPRHPARTADRPRRRDRDHQPHAAPPRPQCPRRTDQEGQEAAPEAQQPPAKAADPEARRSPATETDATPPRSRGARCPSSCRPAYAPHDPTSSRIASYLVWMGRLRAPGYMCVDKCALNAGSSAARRCSIDGATSPHPFAHGSSARRLSAGAARFGASFATSAVAGHPADLSGHVRSLAAIATSGDGTTPLSRGVVCSEQRGGTGDNHRSHFAIRRRPDHIQGRPCRARDAPAGAAARRHRVAGAAGR